MLHPFLVLLSVYSDSGCWKSKQGAGVITSDYKLTLHFLRDVSISAFLHSVCLQEVSTDVYVCRSTRIWYLWCNYPWQLSTTPLSTPPVSISTRWVVLFVFSPKMNSLLWNATSWAAWSCTGILHVPWCEEQVKKAKGTCWPMMSQSPRALTNPSCTSFPRTWL